MEGNTLNLQILGLKARIRSEMYRLLTIEANLYLPSRKKNIYLFRKGYHPWEEKGMLYLSIN